MEFIYGLINLSIKVIGKMMNLMETESTFGQVVADTMENGNSIKWKAMANYFTKMAENTQAYSRTT